MSRGLGKIQREIIQAFQKENTLAVWSICNSVFKIHDAWGDLIPPRTNRETTPAEYQSICRALRTLQKRGMVDIQKEKIKMFGAYRNNDRYDCRGGQSYYKTVKCLIQCNPAMDSTLTTTNKCLVQNHLTLDSTLKNIQRYCND